MKKSTLVLVALLTCIILLQFPFRSYAQENSKSEFSVREELDVKVAMRDGIRLSTNIYLPDAPGSFPVILVRSPYGNGGKGNREGHFFAGHGYVYISQDTRGRYESEGLYNACQDEAKDGYDMQQWIGKQPWCNGKLGTTGGSYVGFTQWMPAPLQSPYLKTMIPAVTFSNLHDVVYQDGAYFMQLFSPWSFEMTKPSMVTMDYVQNRTDSVLFTLPLIDQDVAMGWRISYLRDWLSHPDNDTYWDETEVGDHYSDIQVSSCNIGGWYDILLGSTIGNYLKMTDKSIDPDIRKRQKLIIGPWIHNWNREKVGEMDFGENAKINTSELFLRWFDNQLKGIDNGILEEPPVRIFVMGSNTWRDENEWPLARTKYTNYYFHSKGNANSLSGNGMLNTKPGGKEAEDRYTYDPADPVRTVGGMGPYDQAEMEQREDILVYTTPDLKKDIEVTGPVKVILYASSSAVNTDFTAKMTDVYPDGRSMRICEGIIRASHWNKGKAPSNIEAGKIYEYTIDLWATSNLFKKGHKIRVEISSSNFPRFDRNLNTGNYFATDTTMVKANQVIYHTEEYPSCIVLPVIE